MSLTPTPVCLSVVVILSDFHSVGVSVTSQSAETTLRWPTWRWTWWLTWRWDKVSDKVTDIVTDMVADEKIRKNGAYKKEE